MTEPIVIKKTDGGPALHESEPLLPADPMISMIERIALDPDSDITKLERMIELKAGQDAANAKAMFAESFSMASAEFPQIPLNGRGHNGKPYATLEDITKLTRPVLSRYGLVLTFSIDVGEQVAVTAKLLHRAGHYEQTKIALPRDTSGSKNAVQAIGSTQKYGQRYTAQAILGLSLGEDDEDDGRGAGPALKEGGASRPYSWANTVIQDLPETATTLEKAAAIAEALCSQFKRMKGTRQIDNEWDRRSDLIASLEEKHPHLWGNVIQAYEERRYALEEARCAKESGNE